MAFQRLCNEEKDINVPHPSEHGGPPLGLRLFKELSGQIIAERRLLWGQVA